MGKEYKFKLPLFVQLSKKEKAKKYSINMNAMNNIYWGIKHKVKQAFYEAVKDQIIGQKITPPFICEYTLHMGSRRKVDRNNFLCQIDKYMLDCLQFFGVISDDSDNEVVSTTFKTGDIIKGSGYAELIIREVDSE